MLRKPNKIMFPFRREKVEFHHELPFGLTIGPQRAGTTWIDRYLRERGDVCLPHQVKETFYFDKNYRKGLKFYKDHFEPQENHQMLVEVSATAFNDPRAPERVYNLFGQDVKLVCPLRHPISRSYSLYRHHLQYGMVSGTLERAARKKPEIITSSFYAEHLERWFRVFGEDKIKVLFLEELRDNPKGFTEKLCDGFDLPYWPPLPDMRAKKNNYAVQPPHPFIANIGQQAADFCRDIGAYEIIEMAKKVGLKRFFFGTGKREEDILLKYREHALLTEELSQEVRKLEDLLGYKIPLWDDYELNVEKMSRK